MTNLPFIIWLLLFPVCTAIAAYINAKRFFVDGKMISSLPRPLALVIYLIVAFLLFETK